MSLSRRFLPPALMAMAFATTLHAEPAAPPITIGVSPPRFELEIGPVPTNKAIRVFNFGATPIEIQTYVRSWDLDEQNRVRILEPTEQSLDQWIILNPLRFTIAPGESQTVRFSIRPKVRPEPGEHRAIIYFEQPPAEHESVTVVGRIGVAVYAFADPVDRDGNLNGVAVDTRADSPVAGFDISNSGTAHVRLGGQYAVWPAANYPGNAATAILSGLGEPDATLPGGVLHAGFLPSLPVLPGSRRTLPLNLPPGLPPGEYVLDVNGDLSGKPIDMAVSFSVPPPDVPRAAAE